MELKSWLRRTDWCPLKNIVINELDDKPASYLIAAHKEIHRAVGINAESIPIIGKTGSLKRRIWQFVRSARAPNDDIYGRMVIQPPRDGSALPAGKGQASFQSVAASTASLSP